MTSDQLVRDREGEREVERERERGRVLLALSAKQASMTRVEKG